MRVTAKLPRYGRIEAFNRDTLCYPPAHAALGMAMLERPGLQQDWDELGALYLQAVELLEGLDRLELHQAAAHVSMAVELMRQRHPYLSALDANSRIIPARRPE